MMNELESLLSELSEDHGNYENYSDMRQIGNINNLPEELNNPFNSNCITRIAIRTYKSGWNSVWNTSGTVTFEKGNTTGEQEFDGTDLVDVLRKIYIFVNNL